MVNLGVGYALDPADINAVTLDPTCHAKALERVAEVALLVPLFCVGLKISAVPLPD